MAAQKRPKTTLKRKPSPRRPAKVQTLHLPEVQTLHPPERVIRRVVLNQPSSRFGMKPGWFRDTISAEEHESLRAHIVLWTRGRVYFENGGDYLPRCQSADGARPSEDVVEPISPLCDEWDERGLFQPQCRLAVWHTGDGERRSPVCKESWSLLGIAQEDGLPFWISLKGASLKPTRQFLTMCHARIRMQGVHLFQCAITLASVMVENQYGQFYIVQFRQPEWISPDDHPYAALADMAATVSQEQIERTFEHESKLATDPGPATARSS